MSEQPSSQAVDTDEIKTVPVAEEHLPFTLGNSAIAPGTRAVVDIPFGKLYTHTELNIGAHVVHGKRPGPVLLITAALHGDEIMASRFAADYYDYRKLIV